MRWGGGKADAIFFSAQNQIVLAGHTFNYDNLTRWFGFVRGRGDTNNYRLLRNFNNDLCNDYVYDFTRYVWFMFLSIFCIMARNSIHSFCILSYPTKETFYFCLLRSHPRMKMNNFVDRHAPITPCSGNVKVCLFVCLFVWLFKRLFHLQGSEMFSNQNGCCFQYHRKS